ncbi:uncharacterized protein LOC143177320 [Calliopsis andreniformis]|uniref:uncharacterized protein LOC143177320 n=1 Tax=Calliopsis andreniformis TaxID=337506 RepID=UPI003FCE88C9
MSIGETSKVDDSKARWLVAKFPRSPASASASLLPGRKFASRGEWEEEDKAASAQVYQQTIDVYIGESVASASMWRGPLLLAFLVHCSSAEPVSRDHLPSSKEDVESVESLRRDVREPAPLTFPTEVEDLLGEGNAPKEDRVPKKRMKNASGKSDEGGYYKTYGSDAEGEKGYLKATYSKGNHGYKTLDTFHKRDGDKYAFEKHVAYGKARADEESGHEHDAASHSRKGGDHDGAGTIVDAHYAADEGDLHDHGNEHVEAGDHDGYAHDGDHYTDHGPESSSYDHSESYTDGDGDDGSYESHSSYSRNYGDQQGSKGGHYY